MRAKISLVTASTLLLVVVLACNFSASTANISDLKVGKDKSVSQEAGSFAATDPIYAVATISNNPGKVKVKGRLAYEDVEGQQPGPVPGVERTLEMDGSGTAIYTFTPPPDGWPKGKYKVEVFMLNEAGEQKDQKSSTLSVL